MLGLLLLYFVGKAFYNLAHEYNKSQWGFAILGIISYYAGTMIFGLVIGVLSALEITNVFDDMEDLLLGFIALPFGVLACWGFYKFLENYWSKQPKNNNTETLDGDFIQPNP